MILGKPLTFEDGYNQYPIDHPFTGGLFFSNLSPNAMTVVCKDQSSNVLFIDTVDAKSRYFRKAADFPADAYEVALVFSVGGNYSVDMFWFYPEHPSDVGTFQSEYEVGGNVPIAAQIAIFNLYIITITLL